VKTEEGSFAPDLFQTMQSTSDPSTSNDFKPGSGRGRTNQVIVGRRNAPFRPRAEMSPSSRSPTPGRDAYPPGLGARVQEVARARTAAVRYNAYPAADINGGPAPG